MKKFEQNLENNANLDFCDKIKTYGGKAVQFVDKHVAIKAHFNATASDSCASKLIKRWVSKNAAAIFFTLQHRSF